MSFVSTLPAVFMRGGTSKGLMLWRRDLPANPDEWPDLLLAAMGSPDLYGRQLNGMGGGFSSLSKVCIVDYASRPDADLDYTFAQVLIREARIDYRGNCGNMSAAVGPYALDRGALDGDFDRFIPHGDGMDAVVRLHNTNTGKLIVARFPVCGSEGRYRSVYAGNLEIPGVSGRGAPIRLEFLDPGGAMTGRLLPAGVLRQVIAIPGYGPIEVSMVDAANATVFVRAADLGLIGDEAPEAIEQNVKKMDLLGQLRCAASVAMGLAANLAEAARFAHIPYIVMIASPHASCAHGNAIEVNEPCDVIARAVGSSQVHRSLPLTVSLCLAVAARIEGSLVHETLPNPPAPGVPLRIAMPSGVLTVDAQVDRQHDRWHARTGAFYRTARPLFSGQVHLR